MLIEMLSSDPSQYYLDYNVEPTADFKYSGIYSSQAASLLTHTCNSVAPAVLLSIHSSILSTAVFPFSVD